MAQRKLPHKKYFALTLLAVILGFYIIEHVRVPDSAQPIDSNGITTSGNKIFKDGAEFSFRGATRWDSYIGGNSDFRPSRYRTLFGELRGLNLNTVRFYMNWVRFVRDSGFRENLRRILDIADEYDVSVIYVGDKMNSMDWSQNVWFYPPYVHPDNNEVIPNRDSLISRYASKWLEFEEYENFFLEFFNEPMVGSIQKRGSVVRRFDKTVEGLRVWEADIQMMISYLRSNGFQAPIVIHWAYGTSYPTDNGDSPLTNMNWYKATSFSGSNLIYAQGNYRYHGAIGSDISNRDIRPTDRASILEALEGHGILYAHARNPVLIYECGAHQDSRQTDDIWLNNLLKIFNERGISWIAHGYSTDKPWGFLDTSTENVIRERAADPVFTL